MSIQELATVTALIDKERHMLPRSSQSIVSFGHAMSQPPRSGFATRPIVAKAEKYPSGSSIVRHRR